MEHGGRAIDLLITIRTVPETGSTNADLLEIARAGGTEGQWLRAERQTSGRGRQGRAWQSPIGNLYASTIVRWRSGDPSAPSLALVAGIALAEIVAMFVPAALLKWPNDIVVGDAKLAGILLERADDAIVVGFGINVASHPVLPGRATTSLDEAGGSLGPAALVDLLSQRFAEWLARWRSEGIAAVIARWLDLAHPPGTMLRAALPDQTTVTGSFVGLDGAGALMLALPDGAIRTIHAGDIFAL